jgi:hypothetical protein
MAKIWTLVFGFICFSVSAQQTDLFTNDFSGNTFADLVSKVEVQTPYRFYFQPRSLDSLKVTGHFAAVPIQTLLTEVLQGTPFEFSIYKNSIFILKGKHLYISLPKGFFEKSDVIQPTLPIFDYSHFDRNEKVQEESERINVIGKPSSGDHATLSGNVKDSKTGEPLIGSSVYIDNPTIGVSTDQFGYYSLQLPVGKHLLKIKSLGMKPTQRNIMLYSNGALDIELSEDVVSLKEVLVHSERNEQVNGLQMGTQKLDIKMMKQIPLALGETDILKVITTLPGVQTVGEGTSGLNVRGGSTSQNLILYNDAFVYNPAHLFGFFSSFNPDVIKSVELYKSGVTADYGGRISSIIDIRSREGNLKKFSGSGGLSPITGRLTLEGPIIKDKTSILIGVRSTYSDWLLKKVESKNIQNSSASFYDLTATLSHQVNSKNNLFISGYQSSDQFKLNSDTLYQYKNQNVSLKWKSLISSKLYATFVSSYSNYAYSISHSGNPVNAFEMRFLSNQLNAKADFNYSLNKKHSITAGVSTIRYQIDPGNLQPASATSNVKQNVLQTEQAFESAIYVGDNYEVNPKISIYYGLRYSLYRSVGPKDVYQYREGQPLQTSTITDTLHYSSGSTIATYGGIEPRISLRYTLNSTSSIKLSYNRMRQYIQQLSNTTAIAPTDIWKLCDTYIKPQIGDQFSIGHYKNWKGGLIETSIEAYYKTTQNMMDFKNGAVLFLNNHLETDVLSGNGKAYGIEFLIKKTVGKVNGWLSYTYSRSLLQTQGQYPTEIVNDGKYYASNSDKPHALNFIGNYKFTQRINFSLNVVYSTGRPITIPVAKYSFNGGDRVYFSERNQYRIPDYFRVDISFNLEGSHKLKKLAHSSWTFSVYNLLGRHNPYSVYFVNENGAIKGYQLSIFAQPIPTITYNFKF